MTPSKDLFELVKSMTKAEKGYVKKRLSVFHTNSQNQRLFELIDSQREYNESLIRDELPFHSNNQFAVAKNYLYQFILESLETYFKHTPLQKIKSLLNSVQILSDKGLNEQALKTVEKAKRLSNKYQLNKQLLEIADWEMVFLMNKNQSKEIFTEIQHQNNEVKKIISRIEAEAQAKYLHNYVRNKHLVIGMLRAEDEMQELNTLFKEYKGKRSTKTQTNFLTTYYHLFSAAIYYFTNNDFKQCYQFALQIENLWNTHTHQIEVYPNLYLNFLTRKMLFDERLNQKDKIYHTIQKGMLALQGRYTFDIKTKSVFYIFVLGMYMQYADYKNGLKIIESIEQFRKTLVGKSFADSEEQLYKVTVSDIYFEMGNFKKSNLVLNEIIDNKLRYREDIYCFAFVKSILIHYELAHYDILPYKIKTTLAFLRKQKRLHASEYLIIHFIREQVKTGNASASTKAYKHLKTQLEEVLKNPYEKNSLNYFNFLVWVEAKIQKKTFEEVKLKTLS